MRRKRCSTVNDCAADGAATMSQKVQRTAPPVTALHSDQVASSANPTQSRRSPHRNNVQSRQDRAPSQGHHSPPSSPPPVFATQAPQQQCPRGFFICKISRPSPAKLLYPWPQANK